MKVVAYSIKHFEKGCLAKANTKKHDITLISNALSVDTAFYAEGKNAVIVFTNDDVSETVIRILAGYGIKYIATRSVGTSHIDKAAVIKYGIKIANVSKYLLWDIAEEIASSIDHPLLTNEALQQVADQTICNLDIWESTYPEKQKVK